jgi:type II secretory pathway pseudopilin PulG
LGLGTTRPRAFTLVETVMALGIAMLFLAGIFTLLSVGLTTSKEAADDTVIGLIFRETSNRVRGKPLSPAPNDPSKLFFDNRGRFVDQDTGDKSKNAFLAVATVATPDAIPPHANLMAVVVKVYALVEPGQTIPTTAPKATFSLLKTSTSGQGWKQLDGTYQPKIDL